MLAGALAAARYVPWDVVPPFCLSRRLLGLPCPLCGMTRAWVHLSHGRVVEGVLTQPAGAVAFVAALCFVVYGGARAAGAPPLGVDLSDSAYRAVRYTILAILLGSWSWVGVRGVG